MLCLGDFVTCRKRFNNQSGGVYIGADHLIPGGAKFFCEKKDCSANFGK